MPAAIPLAAVVAASVASAAGGSGIVGALVGAGAAINRITPNAAGETIRCAFAWDIDAGLLQVAARGAVGAQLTGQTALPIITRPMPGRFSTSLPLAGRIAGIEIRPAAVFGISLAALT